jgi:hypothetical protein
MLLNLIHLLRASFLAQARAVFWSVSFQRISLAAFLIQTITRQYDTTLDQIMLPK